MLRVTPLPPAGVAAGQKRRSSRNPPHTERIHGGVAWRDTGERVSVLLVRPAFLESEVHEQPVMRVRNAAQTSTALAVVDTLCLRMPRLSRSPKSPDTYARPSDA
jgi:hypothetical protein